MARAVDASAWAEATIADLRAKGRRDGGARRAVVELLGRESCCLAAQEIFDRLRQAGRAVGLASVYRALDELAREGHLQRVDVGDGSARFEPIRAGGGHHHHVVCDGCGRVEPFADEELERALHAVERETGYAAVSHDVVLHGVCGDCAPPARG